MARKNLISCLAVILVALTLMFSSTQTAFANEESEKHYQQGKTYFDEKKYDAAITEFKSAIDIEPNNAEYHNNLGVAYGESKEYDKALSELNIAINLAPNEPLYYYNRAYVYKAQGDKEKADFRAYKAQMKNEEANENSSEISVSDSGIDYAQFEDELRRHPILLDFSDEMFDKAAKDFLTAGKMYFNKEEYDKAKDAFNNATMADGMLMGYIDDNSDGILDKLNNMFDDANFKDVSEGEAHFWLGEVESHLFEKNLSTWQNAIDHYTSAIHLGFVEDFVFTARGRAKYELKDYQAAVKDLTTAIEIDATHAEAYKWRAETYFNLTPPDFEKARDDFQKYLDFDGKNLDEETKAVYKDKIDKCEKAIRNNSFAEKLGIGEASELLSIILIAMVMEYSIVAFCDRHGGISTIWKIAREIVIKIFLTWLIGVKLANGLEHIMPDIRGVNCGVGAKYVVILLIVIAEICSMIKTIEERWGMNLEGYKDILKLLKERVSKSK